MLNFKRVSAVAPIRICDIGGWTDTWFARRGTIFNIAVYPSNKSLFQWKITAIHIRLIPATPATANTRCWKRPSARCRCRTVSV